MEWVTLASRLKERVGIKKRIQWEIKDRTNIQKDYDEAVKKLEMVEWFERIINEEFDKLHDEITRKERSEIQELMRIKKEIRERNQLEGEK